MTCVVKPNDLNLLKKYSRCWAVLTILTTLSSHLRLLEIVEPRNLKCWMISTVLPSIIRGEEGEGVFLLKSTIISFVLFTLSSILLSLHQLMSLFTWSRHSGSSEFVISPITVVSSANFSILVRTWQDKHSCVKREYNIGDRTQPWGVPVYNVTDDDKLSPIFTTCSLFKRKSRFHSLRNTETLYLIKTFWWDNCVKGRAKINNKDPSVSIWAVEMLKNVKQS